LLVSVVGLKKSFGSTQALNGISFEIEEGSRMLLLGQNGAGKSTIIKCIMGLLNYEGDIWFEGQDVRKNGVKIREKIGYVPQSFDFFEKLTVKENGELIARFKHCPRSQVEENLKLLKIWEERGKRVGALSIGTRQRMAIAMGLLGDPKLLIFDEPLSSVDLRGRSEFTELVQSVSRTGKGVLVATHLPGLSELADQTIILARGEVVAKGSPRELMQKINAKDRLRIKVSDESKEAVIGILSREHYDVTEDGSWVSTYVEPAAKMRLLDALSRSGSTIDDIVLVPSTIESEYLSLVASGSAAGGPLEPTARASIRKD
jgi:ABC-type multidrug transport system ATPase subunit